MHPLAEELNATLRGTIAERMLSEVGRRVFFPRGIVAQAAEAGVKATRFNATVGMSTSLGEPMHLSDIYKRFDTELFKPRDIFAYAPGGGDLRLRKRWLEQMVEKNPSLADKQISLPLVTSGLTHGLAIIGQLFFDPGDTLVIPDLAWDNYELIYAHQLDSRVLTFPFYNEEGGFNVAGLQETILASGTKEIRLLLNFPNNPTGYTPSKVEMEALSQAIIELAESGYEFLVITDDAYFGLFFEEETAKESVFASLCNAHENIFAIKCDAATKEDLVWGFRIGFITYGSKAFNDAHLDALIKRTLGAIRVTVSNCDRPGQSLLLWAMENGESYEADKEWVFVEMQRRYRKVKEVLTKYEDNTLLVPRPFNSGYFMSFATAGNAEELRVHLLEHYQIGCINIADITLRVAYCSVEYDTIEELIDCIYQAAEEVWN